MKEWTWMIVGLALALCVGCTSPNRTTQALEAEGYTEIEITGYKAFKCSEEDTFSTGFKAVNEAGKTVEGAVCCGVLKGCTIRY